jgi:uncharacterized protein YkwD
MTQSTLYKTALLSACLAALLACGGGGDSPANPPPAPGGGGSGGSGQPQLKVFVEPPKVLSVPEPSYTNAHRLSAFKRLNELRSQAGLGLLKQNTQIDIAAQGHSAYQALNNLITHDEIIGNPGYVAAEAPDRLVDQKVLPGRVTKAGYQNSIETHEVLADFMPQFANKTGAQLIDSLMGTPYHRSGMLIPQIADIGVGYDQSTSRGFLTVNLARTTSNTQGAPDLKDLITTWPPANSTDIPTTMGNELPDPIPENGIFATPERIPAGYAASVHVNTTFKVPFTEGSARLRLVRVSTPTDFKMYEDATGVEVPTKLLGNSLTDSNVDYMGGSVAILPRVALNKNTRYKVVFSGEIREIYDDPVVREERSRTKVSRTWYFTTGNKITYSAEH